MKPRLYLTALMSLTYVVFQITEENQDQRFEVIAKRYVEQYREIYPLSATYLGDHR